MLPPWFKVSHTVAESWLLMCGTSFGDATRDKVGKG
jgi:hypothetical protein